MQFASVLHVGVVKCALAMVFSSKLTVVRPPVVLQHHRGPLFHGFATAWVFSGGTVSGPTVAKNWARGELENLRDLLNLSVVRRK